MKKRFLPYFAFFALWSISQAQSNLELHISPRLGTAAFALDTPVSAGSYEYKITRLEYYISEIKVTHDGGQETAMTDQFLLVRPAVDSLYALGSHPEIDQVESITFSIGVDSAHNHLDPASYPGDHPLAPQNPSMHWGWVAGYRFIAIEGLAGTNFDTIFQVHALGDANYKTVTLSVTAEYHPNGDKTIHLAADYTKVLTSLDVSVGLIEHNSTGKAVTVLNNMKNLVFSAQTLGTLDPVFEGTFRVSPNPAPSGKAVATMMLPAGSDYRLLMTDLSGRVVINRTLVAGSASLAFQNSLNAGVYFVHLLQDGRPVAGEKLVVTP